jgi:hypothetical protein
LHWKEFRTACALKGTLTAVLRQSDSMQHVSTPVSWLFQRPPQPSRCA